MTSIRIDVPVPALTLSIGGFVNDDGKFIEEGRVYSGDVLVFATNVDGWGDPERQIERTQAMFGIWLLARLGAPEGGRA